MALPRIIFHWMKMCQIHHFLMLIILSSHVLAVSRDNFKTCEQSGFCKRQRAVEPGNSPYTLLFDTLNVKPSSIELQLLNKKNNVKFILQLFALQENSIRLKINELSPIKPRYEIPVGDVLIQEPQLQNLQVVEKNDKQMTLSMEKSKIILSSSPFRIDVYTENEPVISLNSQGLMKFEHLREKAEEKPQPEVDEEKNEEEANKEQENEGEHKEEDKPAEEPDMWEETFKTHEDSKPNGPTSVGLDISFPGFDNVYGIPEHADDFSLKSTKDTDPYRLFNLDVFEYELYNPMALYGSVPMMMAHNEQQTVGVYWNNAAETWIDIRSNIADKSFFSKVADLVKGNNEIPQTDTHWMSESGIIDVFLMLGPSPKSVFKQYSKLTGVTPLPPLFAISYHQCRWNYNDEEDVKTVDQNFDNYDIPFDVIWLDIEHTDGKRYFTWAADKFPNSIDMIRNISAKGRKMVNIVDPHLKKDDGYKIYSDCKSNDYFVKNKDNGEYEGWCWPGSSSWPDFINPAVQRWWASKFSTSVYEGTTEDLFIWNDMNEPSVFNGPEITFYKDAKHYGNVENRDVHNVYGFYVHKATAEGLIQRSNGNKRFFVLTRAFFAGSQRYGAVWTGDNIGEWSHLKITVPMLLSLNVAGITFSGADVGGFFRNPDVELQTRWYQAGAYQPFFRAHGHLDTRRREPYLLPEENMKIVRDVLRDRYSFLPFWYTVFYQGEKEEGPVMRPLWFEYPNEKQTFRMDDEYLIGSDLLVKPITEQGATGTNIYFPGKNELWYDIKTYQVYHGLQQIYVEAKLNKIPVFQRGGSIIPKKERVRRSSTLMKYDPFTLVVCLDQQEKAEGNLYIDDYHSYNYKKGEYSYRQLKFSNSVLTNTNADVNGKLKTEEWVEKVIVIGMKRKPSRVAVQTKDIGEKTIPFKYDSRKNVIVIKKPGVNIAVDWTILLF